MGQTSLCKIQRSPTVSAQICGFLRFSARICGFLSLLILLTVSYTKISPELLSSKQKGPGEEGAPRNHPEISSQKVANFECRFPYDSYGKSRRPLLLPAPLFYCSTSLWRITGITHGTLMSAHPISCMQARLWLLSDALAAADTKHVHSFLLRRKEASKECLCYPL